MKGPTSEGEGRGKREKGWESKRERKGDVKWK